MTKGKKTGEGKRRWDNEGTISYQEKEKRWEGRYRAQTVAGSKRRVVYGKEFEECRAKLAQAMADRDRNLIFEAEDLTLEEYLEWWLKGPAKNIRPTTYARYAQLARGHIIPALGRLRIKKLTSLRLETFYDAKLEGLSPRTVNYVHTTVSKALRLARGSPVAEEPRDVDLERDAGENFLEAASGHRMEDLWVLALATGMRKSEILGFKWEDVDYDAGIVIVRRGLTLQPDGSIILDDAKRFASKWRIEVSPRVAAVLKEQRRTCPGKWRDEGFVFTSRRGGYLHPNNLYTAYSLPLLEKAGVPPDPLPRPQAYLRHPGAPPAQRQGQGDLRDVGPQGHSHHPQDLRARPARHATRGRGGLRLGALRVLNSPRCHQYDPSSPRKRELEKK